MTTIWIDYLLIYMAMETMVPRNLVISRFTLGASLCPLFE